MIGTVRPYNNEVSENRTAGESNKITSVNTNGGVHQQGGSSASGGKNESNVDKNGDGDDEMRWYREADDEDEEDVRQADGVRTPNTPTADEYRTHRLTHLPYRSWCVHCVRGKKKNPPHRKKDRDKDSREVPVIALDYMYMTSREADKSNPI
eukprot:12427828-Karenia_brevis.AAC.1